MIHEQILQNPKQEIKDLLEELQKVKQAKVQKCEQLRHELEELEKPFDIEAEAITGEIINAAQKVRITIKTDSGMVRFRGGSIRASYPRKELDDFLESNPELKDKILPYRREIKTKDSISVEVY